MPPALGNDPVGQVQPQDCAGISHLRSGRSKLATARGSDASSAATSASGPAAVQSRAQLQTGILVCQAATTEPMQRTKCAANKSPPLEKETTTNGSCICCSVKQPCHLNQVNQENSRMLSTALVLCDELHCHHHWHSRQCPQHLSYVVSDSPGPTTTRATARHSLRSAAVSTRARSLAMQGQHGPLHAAAQNSSTLHNKCSAGKDMTEPAIPRHDRAERAEPRDPGSHKNHSRSLLGRRRMSMSKKAVPLRNRAEAHTSSTY